MHHQPVRAFLDLDAAGGQPARHSAQPVAFLHPQLGQPLHHGGAIGARRRHRQDRIFVDHAGGAARRHDDTLQRAGADQQIDHRLAGFLTPVLQRDIGAHLQQRLEQAEAQRVGADIGNPHLGARDQQRRHRRKGGRGRIARHPDRGRHQLRLAGQGDRTGVVRAVLDAHRCPEMAQHALGMIAGRFRLDDDGLARRGQAGQQDRRLHLGRGDRQRVFDGQRTGRAGHRQRQPAALAGHEARAHFGQRLHDARHRTAAQRGIAGEKAGDRVPRRQPHQQPRAGTGIAEIQHVLGLGKATHADTAHMPHAILGALQGRAIGLHRLGGVQHILALQQAMDRRLANGKTAEHQRTVRDRLVARGGDGAAKRLGTAGDERMQGNLLKRVARRPRRISRKSLTYCRPAAQPRNPEKRTKPSCACTARTSAASISL